MTVKDAQHSDMSGMAAYYKDPRPYRAVCSCRAYPACQTGWFDAGCPIHGIKSSVGLWDGESEAVELRNALMPKRRMNVRWD